MIYERVMKAYGVEKTTCNCKKVCAAKKTARRDAKAKTTQELSDYYNDDYIYDYYYEYNDYPDYPYNKYYDEWLDAGEDLENLKLKKLLL